MSTRRAQRQKLDASTVRTSPKRGPKASVASLATGACSYQHPCGPVIRGLGVVDRAAIEVSLKVVRRLGVRW